MKRLFTLCFAMLSVFCMAASTSFSKLSGKSASIVITAHNLTESAVEGDPTLSAQTDKYRIVVYLYSSGDSYFGTYTGENCEVGLRDKQYNITELNVIQAEYKQEEDIKIFTATATDTDGNRYTITLDNDPGPLQYDDNSDFSYVFPSYEVEYEQVSPLTYGAYVTGDNEGMYVALELYLPVGKEELTAGTYQAAKYQGNQTFYPGAYSQLFGVVHSFAATWDAAHQKYDKIWYITSGTVTVDENGNIAVSGKNSYKKDINILMMAPAASAIQTLKSCGNSKTVKRLVDGKLIIEHNNKTYNAFGVEIK